MSENVAGVYDGLESVNGRVNGLTNKIQGAFARFYQMIMTEMLSNDLGEIDMEEWVYQPTNDQKLERPVPTTGLDAGWRHLPRRRQNWDGWTRR